MKRETELDLLRLLCVFAVMLLHVCSSVWGEIPLFTPQWAFATALRQTWAVPVLVMITGRLLLDEQRQADVRKYMRRICAAYPFWSAAYQIYYLILRWPDADWKGFLAGCVTGAYHMWYLWMLLGLYAITPLLRAIAREKRLCECFLLLHLLTGVLDWAACLPEVGTALGRVMDMTHLHFVSGYTGLYLLGHYLRKWPPREGPVYGVGILWAVISVVGNLVMTKHSGANSELFTSYLSPTMLPVAAAVFTLFTRRLSKVNWKPETEAGLALASKLSLTAYLCHALVNEGVVQLMGKERLLAQPLWMIPAAVLVALGSFGAAYGIRRVKIWISTL